MEQPVPKALGPREEGAVTNYPSNCPVKGGVYEIRTMGATSGVDGDSKRRRRGGPDEGSAQDRQGAHLCDEIAALLPARLRPQAKARVWLVLDGDILYVDRNGNGDLTDEGEKIKLPEFTKIERGSAGGEREHTVGILTAWPGHRLELSVTQIRFRGPQARLAGRGGDNEAPRRCPGRDCDCAIQVKGEPTKEKKDDLVNMQMVLADSQGVLRFAERPQDAPIVHFRGPLAMGLHPIQKLTRGQEVELKACLGSPGLGKGTFAMVVYHGLIPDDAHPVAEVEFPPSASGKRTLKMKVTLSKRC